MIISTGMVNINELIREFDSLREQRTSEDGVEIVQSIGLTVEEINSLTVDNLLDLKHRGIVIKINSNNIFGIRWKEDGLDISKERDNQITDAIKALNLKTKLENAGTKYYKRGLNDILKLGDKIEDKTLISKILDLDLNKGSKVSPAGSIPTGFSDIFNVINLVSSNNRSLSTLGGKTDYIINKLEITDITEVIFIILALVISAEEDSE